MASTEMVTVGEVADCAIQENKRRVSKIENIFEAFILQSPSGWPEFDGIFDSNSEGEEKDQDL